MKALLFKAVYPCEKVRDLMYDYLEGKLPFKVSMRFHTHLALCPECTRYLRLYRTTADAKAFRMDNPPPDGCLDSTLDFLKKEGILASDE